MSDWRRTQSHLAEAIRTPAFPERNRILEEIVPGGGLTIRGAVDVYRAGYGARLTEALGETFEAVWWALGDEAFFLVCRDYIDLHPSRSYNLSDYGQDFPDFVAGHAEADGLPFLGELACFEWRFKQLFHAPAHEPLAADGARELAGSADAVISIGEACLLFRSRYAVYEIWRLRKKDPNTCPVPEVDGPQFLVAYKSVGETYVKELSAAEFDTLERLRGGHPLTRVMAEVAVDHPDFDADSVARFFQTLFQAGLVCSIDMRSSGDTGSG